MKQSWVQRAAQEGLDALPSPQEQGGRYELTYLFVEIPLGNRLLLTKMRHLLEFRWQSQVRIDKPSIC